MNQASVGYNVELEVFEGPLDLLLHLVRKHELDIMDIPISFVTESTASQELRTIERSSEQGLGLAPLATSVLDMAESADQAERT